MAKKDYGPPAAGTLSLDKLCALPLCSGDDALAWRDAGLVWSKYASERYKLLSSKILSEGQTEKQAAANKAAASMAKPVNEASALLLADPPLIAFEGTINGYANAQGVLRKASEKVDEALDLYDEPSEAPKVEGEGKGQDTIAAATSAVVKGAAIIIGLKLLANMLEGGRK